MGASLSLKMELEILAASHLEHFKFAKDIAAILPVEHPKRVGLQIELNEMVDRMNKIKLEIKANDTIQEEGEETS